MACITTMQRYEIKYLLGAREKEAVLQAMSPYMERMSMDAPPSAMSILIRTPSV